jgi:Pyruvate/2-oxoacid:ferredoxin oxidoreductase gamma subunit
MLVTGVGGTGVVTTALVGHEGHLEGKGVTVLDMTGLAQKGGAVLSHVRIAETPEQIHAVRLASGGADLLLGCDLVVSAGTEALSKLGAGRTHAIVNSHETITGDFTRNPDLPFPTGDLEGAIAGAAGAECTEFLDATGLATGPSDAIVTNLFARLCLSEGLVPVRGEAIWRDRLPTRSRSSSTRAPSGGRRAAIDRALVEARATPPSARPESHRISETLDELIRRRVEFLTAYQDAAYAQPYAARVARIREAETAQTGGTDLTEAVARGLFKLMACARTSTRLRGSIPRAISPTASPASSEGDRRKLRFHGAAADRRARCSGASAEARLRAMDARHVPGAGETAAAARHRVRHFRAHRRAADGTATHRRIRSRARRDRQRTHIAEPRACGRIGGAADGDPRLRACEGK